MNIIIKTALTFLLLIGGISNSFSQSTTLNWIFFIDGKIPEKAKCSMIINTEQKDTIVLNYFIGKILIQKKDFNRILESTYENIVIEIRHNNFFNKKTQNFFCKIPIQKFYLNESYIIFNIDNVKNKKKQVYVEVIGDGFKIVPPYPRRKSMYNVFTTTKPASRKM